MSDFIDGYLRALEVLNGPLSLARVGIVYEDRLAAAIRSEADEGDWLAEVVAEREANAVAAPPADPDPLGLVYVMHDVAGGKVKIGFTTGPVLARMAAIEGASGRTLKLLASWSATRAAEARAHDRWADQRLVGEWFQESPELLEWAVSA